MDTFNPNKTFKYVPINELSNVFEEKEKISSGYYVDINKQLELLTESFEKTCEQNPFCAVEHNTTEYLEHLKKQKNEPEPVKQPLNVEQFDGEIPNVNFENVFAEMSPEDIETLENILNNSLKGVAEEPKKAIKLNCLEEVEFESDSDSVILVSKFPNHNCLELGAAKTLIKLHRK